MGTVAWDDFYHFIPLYLGWRAKIYIFADDFREQILHPTERMPYLYLGRKGPSTFLCFTCSWKIKSLYSVIFPSASGLKLSLAGCR
jgi:hypothetical protein